MSDNDPRLRVSPKALERFHAALVSEGLEDHAIRISAEKVSPIRLSYGLDFARRSERAEHEVEMRIGDVVFWLGPDSIAILQDASIDFVDGSGGASGFRFDVPGVTAGWLDPIAGKFQTLLDDEINPGLAGHGGFIRLVDYRDGTAYVKMGGGCQGCGMANVTLQDGVEARVREEIPEIQQLVDATDHEAGDSPYYRKSCC